MNSTSQLDFHPDVESLNAFAEKALPERERGQIVAHLAVCSHCRQVIFVAQQAASDMEMAAASASAHSVKRNASWFSGWRLAWIPAVALASTGALIVLVHVRHVEPSAEMAKVTTPVAPQNAASIANSPVNNRVGAVRPKPPVSHVMETPPEIKFGSASAGAAYAPAGAAPAPAATSETATLTAAQPLAEREIAVMPSAPAGQGYSAAPSLQQLPTTSMPQRVIGSYSSNSAAAYAPKAKMDEMEARAQSNQKAQARFSGSGGASASQYKKEVAPHSSYDAGAQMPVMQYQAAPEARSATLPSGLTAVSTVTAQNRTLAIDQAGTLFLSEDSGSNWVTVAQQWTGRAVVVFLVQTGAGSNSVAMPGGSAAAVFELMNDKNQIWASVDGKNWKAK